MEQTQEKKASGGKKALWWITGIVLALALLCVVALNISAVKDMIGMSEGTSFSLKVTVDKEQVVFDKTVSAREGETLFDVMQRTVTDNGGVVYQDSEYGPFITAICGYEQDPDTGKYWGYTVNGEYAMVGVSQCVPAEGDAIVWDLSPMDF